MCKVLIKTNGLSHEDWLRYRKLGVGGSDAGAICGLNPYSTAMSVFTDKTSDNTDNYDNEAMRQGRDLEDYVAKRFTEITNLKVRRTNSIYYHEDYPHLLANVDRMIVGENIGLECKTTNILNADKWKDGDVPAHYQIQCHHYMAVTGAKAWYIAVVILGKEFKYVKIDRDEEIIKNLIAIETGIIMF
jgi:putative phage-type endonuclease